jgi:ketosteroid isomerase-like protein
MSTSNSTEEALIRSAIEDFIAAYNAGDVGRLMRVFADDWIDMSEGAPTLAGREAHEKTAARLRETFRKFRGELTVHTEEVCVAGDMAFDHGTLHVQLTPRDAGVPKEISLRFLEIWRKQSDGAWKVSRAMDNSGGAPSGLAGAHL